MGQGPGDARPRAPMPLESLMPQGVGARPWTRTSPPACLLRQSPPLLAPNAAGRILLALPQLTCSIAAIVRAGVDPGHTPCLREARSASADVRTRAAMSSEA